MLLHSNTVKSNRTVCKATNEKRAFVFGLTGYTSVGLANVLTSRGWHITGTYRGKATAAKLRQIKPWTLLPFDPCTRPGHVSEELLESLSRSSHVLSSLPPVALPMYDPVLAAQLKALRTAGSHLDWLGYLSSTGVYGDYGGDWVDESSECRSLSSRGFVRREHETAWASAATSAQPSPWPLHIFRLGGIYGPGRSVLESLQRQNAGPGPQQEESSSSSKQRRGRQKYTSRIHVADICSAVVSSMEQTPLTSNDLNQQALNDQVNDRRNSSASSSSSSAISTQEGAQPSPLAAVSITNIVDDEPAPRSEVVAFTKGLLSTQQTDNSPADQSSVASASEADQQDLRPRQKRIERDSRAEGLEEKRVSNMRMKRDLVQLKHDTYREGMQALVEGELEPFTADDLRILL